MAKSGFFAPNISRQGRLFRGVSGLLLLIAAAVIGSPWWITAPLALAGVFALVEAARGWCLARACGVKTPF